MPADLAAAAWQMLGGRISDASRGPGKNFKTAVHVPEDASFQAKLLGRPPSRATRNQAY